MGIVETIGQGNRPGPPPPPQPAQRSSEASSSRGGSNRGGSNLYAANWFKKPAAKPRARARSKPKVNVQRGLTPQEQHLYDQIRQDFKQAGTASPKKLKRLMQQEAVDQFEVDELTGMGHPEAQDLIKAGISADRVKEIVAKYAPHHPAAGGTQPSGAAPAQPTADPAGGTGFTENPKTPAQYAADVLKESNLPDTPENERLLEIQMAVEGMPGGENNPLATSLAGPGSKSVNSAGVQEYPTLAEGATEEAATLMQPNMSSIYDALKSGKASPQDYANALAASSYEGYSPSANAAYANSYLSDAGLPEQTFPGGGASAGYSGVSGSPMSGYSSSPGADALAAAAGTNLFQGLNNLFGSNTPGMTSNNLQQALSQLTSNPETASEQADTTNAPGSPNRQDPAVTKTNQVPVQNTAAVQAILQQMLPNIVPGSAGKQ